MNRSLSNKEKRKGHSREQEPAAGDSRFKELEVTSEHGMFGNRSSMQVEGSRRRA